MSPAFPDSVPLLTDGFVTLRAHSRADADAILEQCTDPEMQRWTTVPATYTREDAAGFVDRAAARWDDPQGERQWAIEWVDDGKSRFGGSIDLRPGAAPDTASVGFGLHPAARGLGVMSRAVRLAATHAFRTGPWGEPLHRLHWSAVAGNWASRRVAWATGFTFHGMLPGTHPNTVEAGGPALDTWHASLCDDDSPTPALPWFEPVLLEGEAVRLRAWREDDVHAIEERDDPHHWMPGHSVLRKETFPAWLDRRHELMASGLAIEWCIAETTSDRALGHLTLFSRGAPMTADVAELGYQVFPSARGRGVAQAAAGLALEYAFNPTDRGGLGLRRLVAETAGDNAASNRVLEASGFRAWGREPLTDVLPDGRFGDAVHWHVLRDR